MKNGKQGDLISGKLKAKKKRHSNISFVILLKMTGTYYLF